VEVLVELREVQVQIENQTVDRRYVDFAEMADRLEACIDQVRGL
jgi:hypothetical protein